MNLFRGIISATILFFAAACSVAKDASKTSENNNKTVAASRTYAQNYAENGATAIPDLVKKYLSRRYASIHGEKVKLDLLKCIDMYHSEDLEKLVTKYVLRPGHSYIQDSKK